MLSLKCIGTGSSGNAYLVSDGTDQILLDAGLSYKTMQQATGYRMSDVKAAFITHEHGDHSKAVRDLLRYATPTYMSMGTAEALRIVGSPFVECFNECGRYYLLKNTRIRWGMFHVDHDAREPVGFVFRFERTGERLVYITDTYDCKNVFRGLTHIMIECNFDDETMIESNINEARKKRTLDHHMSLEKCLDFLDLQDLSHVKVIYLIHMSDTTANQDRIKKAVQEYTGCHVVVL